MLMEYEGMEHRITNTEKAMGHKLPAPLPKKETRSEPQRRQPVQRQAVRREPVKREPVRRN
jgi:hypothetical protein